MDDLERIKKEEGARVAKTREALGMTRAEFAGALGIGNSTLSNIEAGRYRMGARRMQLVDQMVAEARYPTGPSPMLEFEESKSPLRLPAPSTTVTTDMVRQVLAVSEEEPIRRAANALAEALGLTERDAIAQIIAAKLRE